MWYGPVRRRVNIPALLDEFTRTLYEEVDYLAEGRNAETFAANFRDFPGVRVPRVFWTHTSKRVLTLENVGAIKITDYPAVTAAGIDRRQVASRLLKTYLKQIFEDGFFHADPHPGNLFVTPLAAPDMAQAEDWLLTFIDFGMVGRISPKTRAGARELLIAVGTRDAGRVIKAYQMLGMLLPGADLALLERANQQMFDRFWGKSMNELQQVDMSEMVNFAIEFRDLLYGLPFQVPQDLIFLGRCVGILSGMCTGLDPELNVWDELAPFARKLLAEEIGSGPKAWFDELGELARKLLALPTRTTALLEKAERGELEVRAPQLVTEIRRLSQAVRRVGGAIIFAALLIGAVQLFLAGEAIFSGVLLGGAALALLGTVTR
jgi:predicted unusual protein kinase regulating ubiquinone biosynthesis (AarF/ABC1/UbiB family)